MLGRPYKAPTLDDLKRHIEARYRAIEARNQEPDAAEAIATARAEAAAAARILRERFGATRVRLFGSLARGDCEVDRGFDLDLAVEGVASSSFFDAWAEAARVTAREVDLVDVRRAPPLLRQRIDEDGIDLP